MRKHAWMVVCLVVTVFFLATYAQAAQPVVRLIATGGTIAMKIDPVKKAPVPAISGEDLLATVPDISKYATVEIGNLQNVPSDYMDAERWVRLQKDQGAKGIVIQALGWGNVNILMFPAIKYAIGKGIPVVISTRVPSRRVLPVYGFEGGGKTLKDAGAIFADDLPLQKARLLLMLALQAGVKDAQALQKFFDLQAGARVIDSVGVNIII